MEVARVVLGRAGVRVGIVGVGSWAFGGADEYRGEAVGWSDHDDATARRALVSAHRLGLDHWDTADAYGAGRAERLIGSVWDQVPRDDIFLASKVGWITGPTDRFYDPAQILRQCEASLRNLRTGHLDAYYLHHCDFGPGDRYLDEAVATVHRLRDRGLIRFVGLSDWNAERLLRCARRIDPDLVQTYRNVVDDDYSTSGLETWVESANAGVLFFSTLKHGLLVGGRTRPRQFSTGDHRSKRPEFLDPGLLARLQRCRETIDERLGRDSGGVVGALVGALLSDARNSGVLLGIRTEAHAETAARAGSPLLPAEAAWVRALYRAALAG